MKRMNESMLPEAPYSFDAAMRATLAQICREEAEKEQGRARRGTGAGRILKRRALAALLAALMLAASIALAAALRYDLFGTLTGGTPEGAQDIIERDLASVTVGDVEVSIKEAAYDGVTLYMVTSARDKTVSHCYGEMDDLLGVRLLDGSEAYPETGGMWTDNYWIDGRNIGMSGGSWGMETGSDTPGEILRYYAYRLDQEGEDGVYLSGQVRVTLPILQPQDAMRWVDRESRTMREPDEGVISFTLDCSQREKTVTETPGIRADVGNGTTAWTDKVIFSPLYTYLTIGYEVAQEQLDAYIAKNGPGVTDEEGNVLFPYSAMDIACEWVYDALWLVDKEGNVLFEAERNDAFYGDNGLGDTQVLFTFPAVNDRTQEVYIAPVHDGRGDMTRAVRVN